ncbi:MAG TPA: anaerobic ribonucleoside-triphosphate reductase [Candidatus Hydrogenedentes bacterium]|nr:anaerobic ribonucleoside-triphosphate reductase [Candidatus Hydrogenedentota bacterium]
MSIERQGDLFDPERMEQEGLFDEQLPLPLPAIAAPEPFRTIVKRDGREESFSKHKIALAIYKAAQQTGGQDYDLAENLASAVTLYLTKRLGSQPPTVDQVHDAVERVLIHMSHVKTALAYARYRDRRARVRRLREGDMRMLLTELKEAREERDALRGRSEALMVRTSADTLAEWNREKIVEALVRETGLEDSAALMIALEVEQQIETARITTLTTALVRELVDAKLVEHGLDEYTVRHRRLGVPLYDAERIIRGVTPETAGLDPSGTDRVLARMVKKEYAFAQIFSTPVTEAHLRGELHIHDVEQPDRLFYTEHTLLPILQQGFMAPGASQSAGPPKRADELLAQLLKTADTYQTMFSQPPLWSALNVYFAPFLQDWSETDIGRFAQMLVYEFAYRALVHSSSGEGIELCWNVPEPLRDVSIPGAEKTFGECLRTARQFAWAILDVLIRHGEEGVLLSTPAIHIALEPGVFQTPEGDAFLNHAAQAAAHRRHVHFLFERGDARSAHPSAIQQITLNLPRAAYQHSKEADLFRELTRLVDLAAMAHQEKRDFLEGLADGAAPQARPLSLLGAHGAASSISDAPCLVAVEGLNECVQFLMNAELHQGEESEKMGKRILVHLQEQCTLYGERLGLHLVLAQNNDPAISRRFALLDIYEYPKTAHTVIKVVEANRDPRYTTGVRCNPARPLNPMERARIEGLFHACLGFGAQSELPLPFENTSTESISDFLKLIARQTTNHRLAFI